MAATNGNQTENLLGVIDKCPPFMAYYGHHLVSGKRLTVDQIAAASGFSARMVSRLGRSRSWKNVRVGVMIQFCKACGVDLFDASELYRKLREELNSPEPFKELPFRRRRTMLALFNMLAASTQR